MPRRKRPKNPPELEDLDLSTKPPKGAAPARDWKDRKERFATIQVFRDLAVMFKEIGEDSTPPMTIAEVVDSLTRHTAVEKCKAILERRLKNLDAAKSVLDRARKSG